MDINKMNKSIFFSFTFFAVIFLGMNVSSYAEEITYSRFKIKLYNDTWKRLDEHSARLSFDEERNALSFWVYEDLYTVSYEVGNNERKQLEDLTEKFLDWNLLADEKGVTLNKKIGEFSAHIWFKVGNGSWHKSWETKIPVYFFSQRLGKHQMVIMPYKATSNRNSYISHNPKSIYFKYSVANRFNKELSEKYIRKSIENYKAKEQKKKLIENDFK